MTDIEYLVRRIFEIETRLQRAETMLVAVTSSQVMSNVAAPASPSAPARRVEGCRPVHEAAGTQRVRPAAPAQRNVPVRVEARAALEQYPHVVRNLGLEWGYPECESYLAKLVIDERGSRRGFSTEVMEELLFLSELLRWRIPKLRLETTRRRVENPRDPWLEHTPPKQTRSVL